MLTPAHTTHPTLSAGLIASIATATWLDTDPAGATLCCLLLLPQLPRSPYETAAVIEQRMRTVATALGLSSATAPPPDIGPRMRPLSPTDIALRFDGTPAPRAHTCRQALVAAASPGTPVALVLGLDALSHASSPAEIDAYLDRAALQ